MSQEIIRQTPLWAENWPIAYSVIQAIVILLVVVLVAALMSFIERRLLALWQDRYGPKPCIGPGGMFQDRCRHAEKSCSRKTGRLSLPIS